MGEDPEMKEIVRVEVTVGVREGLCEEELISREK